MIPLPIVGGSSDWRWASTGRWESEVGGPLDERGMMVRWVQAEIIRQKIIHSVGTRFIR